MTTEVKPSDLLSFVGQYAYDPLGYAYAAFPWGKEGTPLEKEHVRVWQKRQLIKIRDHLEDPAKRHQPLRLAVASGHGIGKSALFGMIVSWAKDTCVDTRVVITSNTEQQLTTKTSPEVAKWSKLALTRELWNVSAMSIRSREAGHEDSWRVDFNTWSKTNTEAFAGLHNKGRRIVLIMDEASGIDDKVWEVASGALTDEDTEIIWIVFGNPTKNSGMFRECFGRHRNLWIGEQIDSRDVEGTNKEYLQSIVDTYGIDSDYAKVRVLGQFPSASSMQFISSFIVDEAQQRVIPEHAILSSDPVIFGLDHARFGDDRSVLAIRQGYDAKSRPWRRWYGDTTVGMIVTGVQEDVLRYMPDAVFIDAGGPNAGGVIDGLRSLNRGTPFEDIFHEIAFGSTMKEMTATFNDSQRVRVANKRAQMWQNLKAWLNRGAIPPDQQLKDDLIGPEYVYQGDQAILLEKKEHMKKRGLPSPDEGDALALTFGHDVAPRREPQYLNPINYGIEKDFDRYAELPGYQAQKRGEDYDRYAE
jgi:hypothetical protein